MVWNFRTWSLQYQTDKKSRPITRSHNSLHTVLSTHAINRNYDLHEKKIILLSNPGFSPRYDSNIQNNDYSLFYTGVATFLAPCQFSMKDNFDSTCSSCFQSPNQLHILVFINYFVQIFFCLFNYFACTKPFNKLDHLYSSNDPSIKSYLNSWMKLLYPSSTDNCST